MIATSTRATNTHTHHINLKSVCGVVGHWSRLTSWRGPSRHLRYGDLARSITHGTGFIPDHANKVQVPSPPVSTSRGVTLGGMGIRHAYLLIPVSPREMILARLFSHESAGRMAVATRLTSWMHDGGVGMGLPAGPDKSPDAASASAPVG